MADNDDILYIPKGGMCRVCKYRNEDCSKLPFHTFRPIDKIYEGGEHTMTVVKCKHFGRVTDERR